MAGNFWKSSHYEQWLLNSQELDSGRKEDLDVLDKVQMQKLHIFYANFIQALGEFANLRQQVIATACVYFKRFYVRNSLSCVEPVLMSLTALHLACMVEECGTLTSNKMIFMYTSAVKAKYSKIFPIECQHKYPIILECEFLLLEMMDCCLIVYHPYRPLLQFIADIQNESLLSPAWRIVNDTYRSDICLLYPPYLIALACLHMAAVLHKIDIKQWFVELNVDLQQIASITRLILELYKLWKEFDELKEILEIMELAPRPKCSKDNNNNNNNNKPITNTSAQAIIPTTSLQQL